MGEAHRRYTRRINFREKWRGHLWQERFASYPMDETHLIAAVRYVEMNPVAAGLTVSPEDYPWSSAHAHFLGEDDKLVKVEPLLAIVGNWPDFLFLSSNDEMTTFRKHERSGRPLGEASFIDTMEILLARPLRKKSLGQRAKGDSSYILSPGFCP